MALLRRFPPEVLEQIFIYLEYEDLKQVRRASKYFNDVINNCPNLATKDVCIVNTTFKRADFSYIAKLIDTSSRKKWNLHIDDVELKFGKSSCTSFWNTNGWKLHSISLGKIDKNIDALSSIILECVNLQELSMSIINRKVVENWVNNNCVATSDEIHKKLENRMLKLLKIDYTDSFECSYTNYLLQMMNFLKIFPNVTKSLMLYKNFKFDFLSANDRMVLTSFLCQRPNLFFYISGKPHHHGHTDTVRLHMSQVSQLYEYICTEVKHNFNNNEIEIFTCKSKDDISLKQIDMYIEHLPNLHTLIIPYYKLDERVLKRLQILSVKTLHVNKFEDAINSETYISKSKNCVLESLYLKTFQLGSTIFANLKMLYTKKLSVNDFEVICNGSFPCLEIFTCYYVTGQFSEAKIFDIFISNLPSLIYLGIPNYEYLDYSVNLPKLKYFVAYDFHMNKSKNITPDFFSKKFLCPRLKMISAPLSFFGINDKNPIETQLIKFIYPLKELKVFISRNLENKISDIDISKIREVCPVFKLIRGLDFVWCWDDIKCESFKFNNPWLNDFYENVDNGNTFWNIMTSRLGVNCKVTACEHDYRTHRLPELSDFIRMVFF